jgi:hypothetical protein
MRRVAKYTEQGPICGTCYQRERRANRRKAGSRSREKRQKQNKSSFLKAHLGSSFFVKNY